MKNERFWRLVVLSTYRRLRMGGLEAEDGLVEVHDSDISERASIPSSGERIR